MWDAIYFKRFHCDFNNAAGDDAVDDDNSLN